MSRINKTLPEAEHSIPGILRKSRKPYRKPQLEELGDLRTLTLGGSPGIGDSGGGQFSEFPPGVHSMPPPGGYPRPGNPNPFHP